MISMLIEAALRALVVALTVWTGLRLFRVGNVLAQKIAWGLVLASAVAMPQLMRWQVLPSSLTVRIPATSWPLTPKSSPVPAALALSAPTAEVPLALPTTPLSKISAPPELEPRATIFIPEHGFAARQFVPKPHSRRQRVQSAPAQLQSTPIPAKQASPADATTSPFPQLLAAMLYLAVCAVLLIRMLYGLLMAIRLWFAASPYEADLGQNPEQNPALGLHLRFSFAISSPVTIGSGVLLPADCLTWDREKLRIVLAHERAHVRQGDFYLQLLASLYTAALWFSPLGWWLKRELSDLGEAISDRAGLNEAASRTSYAQVLLEFAALPRPTVLGVAMARTSNLSHRMERFLDESRFRQAFAGSRRRMLLVGLLVPIALFAGTALVRVEAAAYSQPVSAQIVLAQSAPTIPAPTAPTPAAAPNPAPAPAAPSQIEPDTLPDSAVPPPPADVAVPAPPSAPGVIVIPAGAPIAPLQLEPPHNDGAIILGDGHTMTISRDDAIINTNNVSTSQSTSVGKGYAYSYSSSGDSWALVTDPSDRVKFSGDWHDSTRESIDRARKLTNGKFLWFTHDGKSYFIDEPTILTQIQAMYAPMEALGKQQESVSISTPDISKQMAELNAATAKLQAKAGSTVSQEELAEVEAKLAEVQARLGALQGEVGARQGKFGELQGKLGEQQGKLGEEQGRLGEKQGKLAQEADRKVHSIIDETLRDGKARPVQ
jgi:beta-lactamase regulating signal transducer with metallopeptidase domain